MADRKLRLRMSDLNAKSVHEIIRLAEHLEVVISGCCEKRELINRIATSPLVEIITSPLDSARPATSPQSAVAKLIGSRQERMRRSEEMVEEDRAKPEEVRSVGDLAGQIMAELRQTAARLDFQLNECTTTAPTTAGGNQQRTLLTSVGQSIVGNSGSTGGA